MSVWVRVPSGGRLIRVEIAPFQTKMTPILALKFDETADEKLPSAPAKCLNQIFYPPRSTNLSCFQIPNLCEMPNLPLVPNAQLCFLNLVEMMMPTYSRVTLRKFVQ